MSVSELVQCPWCRGWGCRPRANIAKPWLTCCHCRGRGRVTPEVAASFDAKWRTILRKAKARHSGGSTGQPGGEGGVGGGVGGEGQ